MTSVATATVVIVRDDDTDAGYRLARSLLADGRRVAVVARRAAALVRVLHGYPSDRVMLIAADVADRRQWSRVLERATQRLGRIDAVVHADVAQMRESA